MNWFLGLLNGWRAWFVFFAAGAALALAGALAFTMSRNGALRADLAGLRVELAACSARTADILEDKESDDAVDNLPAGDLADFGSRWLRPAD